MFTAPFIHSVLKHELARREIVILDFNHLYKFDASVHREHIALIMLHVGVFAAMKSRHGPQSTLCELYEARKRAFILYDDADSVTANDHLFSQGSIKSQWLNQPRPDLLLREAQIQWLASDQRRPDAFFVCQGLCTPDKDTIIHSVVPPYGPFRSLEDLARSTTEDVTCWLSRSPIGPGGVPPSIFIVDFFDSSRFVQTVVLRNYAEHGAGALPVRLFPPGVRVLK